MKKHIAKVVYAGTLLLALPLLAFAQRAVPQVSITSVDQILNVIERIVNLLATIFFTIAVIFVFWAGWTYLGSAGEPEKLDKAKNQLIYAAVAIAIGLIAFSFTRIVENFIR